MIKLEPIPSSWGMLQSTVGKPSFGENEQKIMFSVRVPKRRDTYTCLYTRLASGEILEDLEGGVTLYRGKKQMENGQPFPNAIFYVPPCPEVGVDKARFSVQLFLEERLFDQVVTLSRPRRLPWIDLDFDFMKGPITYGNAPDGSEKIWNNKEHGAVNIIGASLSIPLADQVDEKDNKVGEPPLEHEMMPPTLDQLDRRFRETHELLTQLRRSLSLLTWTVLGIAVILIGTRFV